MLEDTVAIVAADFSLDAFEEDLDGASLDGAGKRELTNSIFEFDRKNSKYNLV